MFLQSFARAGRKPNVVALGRTVRHDNVNDSEMHEEVLGIIAIAIGKAEAGFFFRDDGSR